MHKYKNIYYFIDDFNKKELIKLDKKIGLIYRNYNRNKKNKDLIDLINFCKKKKFQLFISNNYKIALKYKLNGLYIPSFNKSLRFNNILFKKDFKIIGSAHNISEIKIKEKQNCSEILVSPLFKTKNNRKRLDIIKFNLMVLNFKKKFIALGGINFGNFKKINLTKSVGFASITWIKKTGLVLTRPV